ncbi:glycosyltransferase [Candidatus Woesebacteria bacterium]|nr:glycosyltransferase [Candidatus Woesebacteria bacterium]
MKIALVHDQLQEFGGAERVLVALKKIYPQADVYTSFYNPRGLGEHNKHFEGWHIHESWASRIPFFGKLYSPLRFLAPWIWESFDFSAYDVVMSSSGWYMSKGIITKPDTQHICYLHHQPRYLYHYPTAVEWQKYLPVNIYAHIINHGLRMWDFESSQRVDFFIANSEETKSRIKKFYRRDAHVIYPPVAIPATISESAENKNYFVTTARLARAKHIDLLIKAANKKKFSLKIIGRGRDEEYLRSIAGPTVEFLSYVEDKAFANIYQQAKAFLFAAEEEEFGIAPVEAMGYGLPVVAYASGGLKETVKHKKNGYLFNALTVDALLEQIAALDNLSKQKYHEMQQAARKEAECYSFAVFEKHIKQFVENITQE